MQIETRWLWNLKFGTKAKVKWVMSQMTSASQKWKKERGKKTTKNTFLALNLQSNLTV